MSRPVETPLSDCDCCRTDAPPPTGQVDNPPGSSSIAHRVGTHAGFMSALREGAAARSALRQLRTQQLDDPAVALFDAWASTLDVLTFYTERIANEGYLRTASELLSLVELARTVGHERGPGRASETTLVFTLDDSPGSPAVVPVPAGTKVASMPGPGEIPQTFETNTDLIARPEHNAIAAQTRVPVRPVVGDTSVFLAGAATGLRPGDHLLLTGGDDSPVTGRWVLRAVRRVAVSGAAGAEITEVGWDEPLGTARRGTELVPEPDGIRVYALRVRAPLFGANAPDWRVIPDVVQDHYEGDGSDRRTARAVTRRADDAIGDLASRPVLDRRVLDGPDDWPHFTVVPPGAAVNTIDLDGDHPQIGAQSWAVLQRGDTVALYAVASAAALSRSDYALSGKVTRLALSGGPDVAGTFAGGLRTTVALVGSDGLELAAAAPLTTPVQGRSITLARPQAHPLPSGRPVVVSGPRPTLVVADGVHTLVLVTAEGVSTALHPGELLVALAAAQQPGGGNRCTWTVRRRSDDVTGTVVADGGELAVVPATDADPVVAEQAIVAEAPDGDGGPDRLHLRSDLANVYDRAAVRVFANVVDASHGETRIEILGGGDAGAAFQRFRLAQAPLTYRVDASGAVSSLEIRVDGVRWDEVSSLANAGSRDLVYVTRTDDEGRVSVIFGDGTFGARLPTGHENVAATYRVGTGLAGRLPAGRLTMLLTRPLGVRGVTNLFATGTAADLDSTDALRRNAPTTALTFDRVVSLSDFADFARATPGIAKSSAAWTWNGQSRVVHLTVAGDAGQPVDDKARADLAQAIRQSGDARRQLVIEQAAPATFDVAATLIVDSRLSVRTVLEACAAALERRFGFDARSIGQAVAASEVMVCAQGVPGVVAVTLTTFRRSGAGGSTVEPLLPAAPTELLTIRPGGITLVEEGTS